jgi:2'-5' RNA ligase
MEQISAGDTRSIAPHQLNLLEPAALVTRPHKLFFAVLPPAEIAASIREVVLQLRVMHRFGKTPFPPSRLHVSLQGLGDHVEYPSHLVRYAMHAASRVISPHFIASFDRVLSFCGRPRARRDYPLVLRESTTSDFVALNRALAGALRIRARSSYTPHITLLYDKGIVEERRIVPINWKVDEFVLIHSEIKEPNRPKKPYSILGRWQLR